MTLIRWRPRRESNPFGEVLGIQDEINRLFDVTLGRLPLERMGLLESEWAPAIDVLEDENRVVVRAELPGIAEKDIDISVMDKTLTIKGEKRKSEEKQGKSYHRLERAYGAFHRYVTLPTSVAPDRVRASFKNGMLEIDLPKKEEAKPKQIKLDVI